MFKIAASHFTPKELASLRHHFVKRDAARTLADALMVALVRP
jgi:hypothetical protein